MVSLSPARGPQGPGPFRRDAGLSLFELLLGLTTLAGMLAIATPGVFGPAYFQEVADVIAAAAGGPPDPAAIGAVMRRHGLTPALPAMPTTA